MLRDTHVDDVPKIVAIQVRLALGEDVEGYGDVKAKDRIAAGNAVLDRLLGKALQTIDATVSDVTPEQQAMLAALRMTPHERRLAIESQDKTEDASQAVGDESAELDDLGDL